MQLALLIHLPGSKPNQYHCRKSVVFWIHALRSCCNCWKRTRGGVWNEKSRSKLSLRPAKGIPVSNGSRLRVGVSFMPVFGIPLVSSSIWISTLVSGGSLRLRPISRRHVAVLLHVVTHGKVWAALQNAHHAFVSLSLLSLLACDSLLAAIRLPLFYFLDLAPGERAIVSIRHNS